MDSNKYEQNVPRVKCKSAKAVQKYNYEMNVLPKHLFIESQFLITAYILSTLTDCWRTGPIDRLLLFFTSTKMYKLGHLGMQYNR